LIPGLKLFLILVTVKTVFQQINPPMSINFKHLLIFSTVLMVLASCGTIEKASVHGLNSGFYKYSSEKGKCQKV